MPSDAPEASSLFQKALGCRCPRCGDGALFKSGFLNLSLNDNCGACGLPLAKNDSADGPAVFLIFVLGFLVVPLALFVDHVFTLPIWVHLFIWTPVCLGIIFGLLRPIKSLVLAQQWKHRASNWSE